MGGIYYSSSHSFISSYAGRRRFVLLTSIRRVELPLILATILGIFLENHAKTRLADDHSGDYTLGLWFQALPQQYEPVAQLVEQRTFNPWVVGSSPAGLIFTLAVM